MSYPADFEQKLLDFFAKHDLKKQKFSAKIAAQFHENQELVWAYLERRYQNKSEISLNKTKAIDSVKQDVIAPSETKTSKKFWLVALLLGILLILLLAFWMFFPSSNKEGHQTNQSIVEISQEKLKSASSLEDSLRIVEEALDAGLEKKDSTP